MASGAWGIAFRGGDNVSFNTKDGAHAFGRQNGFVCTIGNDATLLEHDHAVGIARCLVEVVQHRNGRPVPLLIEASDQFERF